MGGQEGEEVKVAEEEEGEEGQEAEEEKEEEEAGQEEPREGQQELLQARAEVEEVGGGAQEDCGEDEGGGQGYLQALLVVAGACGHRGEEERFARGRLQGRVAVHQEQEAEQWPDDQGRREARHGDEGRACLCRRDRACASLPFPPRRLEGRRSERLFA